MRWISTLISLVVALLISMAGVLATDTTINGSSMAMRSYALFQVGKAIAARTPF